MASESVPPEESNVGVGVAGGHEEEGGDEEMAESEEGSEAERIGTAGPNSSSSSHPHNADADMKDDGDEKMSSGTEDDEEEDEGGVDKVTERNRNLLMSGCGKQGAERKKVLHAFWSALWPILEDSGWSKDEGVGKEEGLIFFRTPDHLEEFDRIKDVVDRVMMRKDPAEALAADAYEANLARGAGGMGPRGGAGGAAAGKADGATSAAMSSSAARRAAVLPISRNRKKKDDALGGAERGTGGGGEKSALSTGSHPGGKHNLSSSAKAPHLSDVSWKEGRSFPKKSSSIGNRYQVSHIPEAGTFDPAKPPASEQLCTLIWDPAKAQERGVNDKTIADLPPGIKEAALFRLAELGYDEAVFLANVKSIKPTDGSNWGPERRERFRDEVFRSRKDFKAVCRSMRIPMKTCLAYYYGTFKFSDDYRLLKSVCCEEDAMRMEANEHAFDACAVCGDGGNLLICDGCEGEYHMECCRPPLRNVPEGHWLCDECVDRKFLAARQYVIKSSRLFERHDRTSLPGTVRGEDGMFEDVPEGVEKVLYKPSDSVLLAVRKFAKGLNQLLATGTVVKAEDKVAEDKVAVAVVMESEDAVVVADAEDAVMEDAPSADAVVEDEVPAPSTTAVEGASSG